MVGGGRTIVGPWWSDDFHGIWWSVELLAAHWRERKSFSLRAVVDDCREFGVRATLRDFYNNKP
jgi:hypothetical protein